MLSNSNLDLPSVQGHLTLSRRKESWKDIKFKKFIKNVIFMKKKLKKKRNSENVVQYNTQKLNQDLDNNSSANFSYSIGSSSMHLEAQKPPIPPILPKSSWHQNEVRKKMKIIKENKSLYDKLKGK